MIYQDFSLFPNLTVAENLAAAGDLQARRWWVRRRRGRDAAADASARLGVALDPDAEVGSLPVAGRQLVAIARALLADVRLMVMDEPTTALTHQEVTRLFRVVDGLKARGIAVLFVSHKMREMLDVADSLTVLRNGRVVAEGPMSSFDEAAITRAMTGHDPGPARPPQPTAREANVPRLEVRGLSVPGEIADVSFSLMPGEVVGLAGLLGSGRTELALALFGMRPGYAGTVLLDGQEVRLAGVSAAVAAGIAYVPEDRLTEGLFPALTINANLLAASLPRWAWQGGWVDGRRGSARGGGGDPGHGHRDAHRGARGIRAVRRQPAAGGDRALAADRGAGADPERPHRGGGRGQQGRHPPGDPPAGGGGGPGSADGVRRRAGAGGALQPGNADAPRAVGGRAGGRRADRRRDHRPAAATWHDRAVP